MGICMTGRINAGGRMTSYQRGEAKWGSCRGMTEEEYGRKR